MFECSLLANSFCLFPRKIPHAGDHLQQIRFHREEQRSKRQNAFRSNAANAEPREPVSFLKPNKGITI